jgi:hypothetical protein
MRAEKFFSPQYTASAPAPTAARNANRLPAGARISGLDGALSDRGIEDIIFQPMIIVSNDSII